MICRECEDFIVEYKDDNGTKEKIFDKLIEFYFEYEAFCGESICQSDAPQINAPELLSTIADDIIQFKTIWKEN